MNPADSSSQRPRAVRIYDRPHVFWRLWPTLLILLTLLVLGTAIVLIRFVRL